MQTFVPSPDVYKSVGCLDTQRLVKQRLEGYQIAGALIGGGWRNHAAVKMWVGAEPFLAYYLMVVCEECDNRGIADEQNARWLILDRLGLTKQFTPDRLLTRPPQPPWWWNISVVHRSHKLNLMYKNEVHYSKYWPNLETPDDKPAYCWPIAFHEYTGLTKVKLQLHDIPLVRATITRYTLPRLIGGDLVKTRRHTCVECLGVRGKVVRYLLQDKPKEQHGKNQDNRGR